MRNPSVDGYNHRVLITRDESGPVYWGNAPRLASGSGGIFSMLTAFGSHHPELAGQIAFLLVSINAID
jgi:hypothetical protein